VRQLVWEQLWYNEVLKGESKQLYLHISITDLLYKTDETLVGAIFITLIIDNAHNDSTRLRPNDTQTTRNEHPHRPGAKV
jgi:hypothetical protein